ncbi:DUF983 domain-containing protein [Polaribacter sp. PL03]|uniref:DUF983 domain-containing protein n=1 Tax=Polaribacter sp. PL03 TaxID=3088353 RepID=UPI0029CF7D50|nr:DUF983 domain-containing protein [Polaribacter sp. PL03]MDX6747977.1 DUF983 domain-containing protein [Polaribacter sp. PL03]
MANVIDVLKCKCPNCKKGKMYSELGNLLLFRAPKMNAICNECSFKFEKEPGFFFGAMFVSYALVAVEMIASVVLFKFILDFSYISVVFVAITTAILLSTINFRISRSIWIYMFYSND